MKKKWVTIEKGVIVDTDSYYKAEIIERNPRSFRFLIKLSHKYIAGVSETFGCFDFEDAQKWIEENLNA